MASFFGDMMDEAARSFRLATGDEIRLGVTGLSRCGKTAFIASLINLVTAFGTDKATKYLVNFPEYEKSGIVSGRIAEPSDNTVRMFPYVQAADALDQNPPHWPEATDDISEIRLEIKYRDDRAWMPGKTRSLFVDVWDYPGEWLMDLTLLDLDYRQFSEKSKAHAQKIKGAADPSEWIALGQLFEPERPADDRLLLKVSQAYTGWLKECKKSGFSFIVPGRFVLPGKLAGTPVLEFVPWVWGNFPDNPEPGSLAALLERRYSDYRDKVVKRFYEDCFKRLDRQIVLIDCFAAMGGGRETYCDVNEAFGALLENFNYGAANFLTRLFAPNIDRVAYCATKADTVAQDQLGNLLELLKSMAQRSASPAKGEGARTEFMCLASVKSSKYKSIMRDGVRRYMIATDYEDELPFCPGELPTEWSEEAMEHFRTGFIAKQLRPPIREPGEYVYPSINMDTLLHYILGDRLG